MVRKKGESDKYQTAWCIQRELLSLKIAESAPDGGTESQNKHKFGISDCVFRKMTKGKRMTEIELAQDTSRKCQNVQGAETLVLQYQKAKVKTSFQY